MVCCVNVSFCCDDKSERCLLHEKTPYLSTFHAVVVFVNFMILALPHFQAQFEMTSQISFSRLKLLPVRALGEQNVISHTDIGIFIFNFHHFELIC